MDVKDDNIEARFARLEAFMNQRHVEEPASSKEADDTQNAPAKNIDKESKESSENFKAGPDPHDEVIYSRFEKALKK